MEENEIRKDYLLDEWVIISKNRSKRPMDHKEILKNLNKKKIEIDFNCPFCLGNEKQTPPEILEKEAKLSGR